MSKLINFYTRPSAHSTLSHQGEGRKPEPVPFLIPFSSPDLSAASFFCIGGIRRQRLFLNPLTFSEWELLQSVVWSDSISVGLEGQESDMANEAALFSSFSPPPLFDISLPLASWEGSPCPLQWAFISTPEMLSVSRRPIIVSSSDPSLNKLRTHSLCGLDFKVFCLCVSFLCVRQVLLMCSFCCLNES